MIVGLVLVSAGLHALWNALLRLEPDKDRAVIGAIAVAATFALLVAGAPARPRAPAFPTATSALATIAAGGFEAVYFASLARALASGKLGLVYTLSRGGAILVVWPMSIVLFAEPLVSTSAAGSGLVLGGLVLSAVGAPSTTGASRR